MEKWPKTPVRRRFGVSVTKIHPQFEALEHVMTNLKAMELSPRQRLDKVIDLVAARPFPRS